MNSSIRDERRLELENRITNALYNAPGGMTLRELADRVGRSKSPAFRKVVSEMVSTGVLTSWWGAYKHTGRIIVDLHHETYNRIWHEHHGRDTWKEQYPYSDGVTSMSEDEYTKVMFGGGW